MDWPFPRPEDSRDAMIAHMYEQMFALLSDESAQIEQYPDPLKSEILRGADCDVTPAGLGSFGTSVTNPIPVNGPIGEILYLSALRHGNNRIAFHRLTSVDQIDIFECVSLDGNQWELLCLDMYHPRKSKRAPQGYTIADDNVLLSGVTSNVADFPRLVYPEIVAYSEKRFGMSIADPLVRTITQKKSFIRSPAHLEMLQQLSTYLTGGMEHDLGTVLSSEVIEAQHQIQNVLVKFSKTNLAEKSYYSSNEIRVDEIAFFSISAAIHSLFRWHQGDATSVADEVTARVLQENIAAGVLAMNVRDAVQTLRARHLLYDKSLLRLEHDQTVLGLELSKAFTGRENAFLGLALTGLSAVIIKAFRDVITERSETVSSRSG